MPQRTVVEAKTYLIKRFEEQCQRYPKMREIPLSMYISRNLLAAILNLPEHTEEAAMRPQAGDRDAR